MRIIIDGDGCPVVDQTIKLANEYDIKCYIFCDYAHFYDKKGATTLVFEQGADSVDFAITNYIEKGDLVVTQDYGLAGMCLAKNAYIINQDGFFYTEDNIDALLLSRYTSKKIRNSGGRTKGMKKRTKEQDIEFENVLNEFLRKKLFE